MLQHTQRQVKLLEMHQAKVKKTGWRILPIMYVATYATPSQIIRNASNKGETKNWMTGLFTMYVATYATQVKLLEMHQTKVKKELDDGTFHNVSCNIRNAKSSY